MRVVICTAFMLAVTLAPVSAQMGQPYTGSAAFEQMKSLVGVWEGEMPMKDKGGEGASHENAPAMMKITVEYRMTAGGTVIQETYNGGSPMEMISMYHDRGGKLSMTHYCMVGNQPRMDLVGSEPGRLTFDFAASNELDPTKGMHMHGLDLSFIDETHITQRWTMYQNGEAMSHDTQLTRLQ
jgi:hypothetical protein